VEEPGLELQPGDESELDEVVRPHAGRPRSAAADDAIVTATARLLVEVGYRAMTMEAVAARAGVGKATLYRRHRDKGALVAAMILASPGAPPRTPPAGAGSAREAMAALLQAAAVGMTDPTWMPVMGAMLSEGPHGAGLTAALRSQILDPTIALIVDIVEAGIASGELRPAISPLVVADILFGVLMARTILAERTSDGWIDKLIGTLFDGLAATAETPEGSANPDPQVRPANTWTRP
jgi:AcrR family transcriptional regulator